MNFGQEFICSLCKKKLEGDYHKYTCNYASINMEFYACSGLCNNRFRSEYVEPFEVVESRWQILDL